MSEKSYVGLDTKVCPICMIRHHTGILLDRRMEDTLERETVTGVEICPECKDLNDQGFIALIGCDPEKSKIEGQNINMDDAHRTGNVAWVHKDITEMIFNVSLDGPFVFTEEDVISELKKLKDEAESDSEN